MGHSGIVNVDRNSGGTSCHFGLSGVPPFEFGEVTRSWPKEAVANVIKQTTAVTSMNLDGMVHRDCSPSLRADQPKRGSVPRQNNTRRWRERRENAKRF